MDVKVLVPCFLLFVLAFGQQPTHTSYDWRTSRLQDWPKLSSLMPFSPDMPSLDDMSFNFKDGPSPFSDETFSAEFDKIPFVDPGSVDQSLSSYENYNHKPVRTGYNMTLIRIGGFAGSGDTRGFGAYDYPRDHHQELPERTRSQPALEELLKIGREQRAGYADPTILFHTRPLSPTS